MCDNSTYKLYCFVCVTHFLWSSNNWGNKKRILTYVSSCYLLGIIKWNNRILLFKPTQIMKSITSILYLKRQLQEDPAYKSRGLKRELREATAYKIATTIFTLYRTSQLQHLLMQESLEEEESSHQKTSTEPLYGTCHECSREGIKGCYCIGCEDSGYIYE